MLLYLQHSTATQNQLYHKMLVILRAYMYLSIYTTRLPFYTEELHSVIFICDFFFVIKKKSICDSCIILLAVLLSAAEAKSVPIRPIPMTTSSPWIQFAPQLHAPHKHIHNNLNAQHSTVFPQFGTNISATSIEVEQHCTRPAFQP